MRKISRHHGTIDYASQFLNQASQPFASQSVSHLKHLIINGCSASYIRGKRLYIYPRKSGKLGVIAEGFDLFPRRQRLEGEGHIFAIIARYIKSSWQVKSAPQNNLITLRLWASRVWLQRTQAHGNLHSPGKIIPLEKRVCQITLRLYVSLTIIQLHPLSLHPLLIQLDCTFKSTLSQQVIARPPLKMTKRVLPCRYIRTLLG